MQRQAREVKMRRHNIQSVPFMVMMCAGLALAISTAVEPSWAQQKSDVTTQDGKKTETASSSKPETARLRAQLKQASDEYKSNLERLLALYEGESKQAEAQLAKVKELLAQGLVTRSELDTATDSVTRNREKVAQAQAQLKSAEVQIAQLLVEAEAEEDTRKVRPSSAGRAVNTLVQTTAYIRYGGARAWALTDAASIQQFFTRRFGRALPIGAFGQSALHDRWGYDHRNAMDIGVNPDSTEGQALMEYLRANGIPFTAFHFAMPGKATAPHIHVGPPSHRTTRS
jgi:hypothetical protein